MDGAEVVESGGGKLGQQSRRAYLRELRRVVESSDVVLQVLDARDPAGSRASAVEAAVEANPRKKLVLVLNKASIKWRAVVAASKTSPSSCACCLLPALQLGFHAFCLPFSLLPLSPLPRYH